MLTDLLQGEYGNHGEVQNSGTALAGKPGCEATIRPICKVLF